jgi:mRNA-degrading endonuclease toxin of MazEF toxin-antitoxin module
MSKVLTGEVYNADLEPVQGSEQGKTRPVFVFQNPDLARFTSTALCIPYL